MEDILRGYSFANFVADLRAALSADGVDDLTGWTSHCVRRGSGTDVLYKSGVAAMLRHGEWDSVESASFYASRDEMQGRELASREIEL